MKRLLITLVLAVGVVLVGRRALGAITPTITLDGLDLSEDGDLVDI